MIVTLWEDKAAQFQEGLQQSNEGPIFVIVTGLLVKKYSGIPYSLIIRFNF